MRNSVKRIVRLVSLVLVSPLVLSVWIGERMGSGAVSGCSQALAFLPGIVGRYLRAAFCAAVLDRCSADVAIDFGVLFPYAQVEIDPGVYIGPYSIIAESVIGRDVIIGSYVSVIGGRRNHNFSDLETPIRFQGNSHEPVHIGEDSWIGNQAIIMADVGKKCVIGAGSVVVDDIPDYSVAVGNPARVVRDRRDEN